MIQFRLILLFTAFIWGTTFAAQRMTAGLIEPSSYNAVRFLLGALTLLPILLFTRDSVPTKRPPYPILPVALLLGLLLACGSYMQQYALIYTTAAKAGFITALYIVLVPLVGLLFLGQRLTYLAAIGVVLAISGVAILTLHGNLTIAWADLVLLIGSFFWTAHIQLLTYLAPRYPNFRLAFSQFLACSFISFIFVLFNEDLGWQNIEATLIPLLWGGVLSVGLGFTGQLVGQRRVPPTEASLILSLEMVFGGIAGYLLLGETVTERELWGFVLMSAGVVLAQLPSPRKYSFSLAKAAPLPKSASPSKSSSKEVS